MSTPPSLPRHIAVILDGNGRWAKKRGLPRIAGHHAGIKAVRKLVQACAKHKIEALTLFAFSSENWGRPKEEVGHLMKLFLSSLQKEIAELHENNIQVRFIGSREHFSPELIEWMEKSTSLTQNNTGLKLILAIDYGGRWDITQACQILAEQTKQGLIDSKSITPERLSLHLSTGNLPEPDLFIRTSGEHRISNFLLWQLAYTELYFTDKHWPDFDEALLQDALTTFQKRGRRFGVIPDEEAHA